MAANLSVGYVLSIVIRAPPISIYIKLGCAVSGIAVGSATFISVKLCAGRFLCVVSACFNVNCLQAVSRSLRCQ
jgi:hypothetical protein